MLEFDSEGGPKHRVEVVTLHRDEKSPLEGDVGMTLDEGKSLMNAIQQDLITEQISQFSVQRRICAQCGALRRLHDSHCSDLKTVFGNVSYCRDRWKACRCGVDAARYVSPLKVYLPESSTPELRGLHAKLGAMLPYRQACAVMELLLPMSGRHNHVTLRNHTLGMGAAVEKDGKPPRLKTPVAQESELGIDVAHVRQVMGHDSSSIAVVTAAVGPVGQSPRIWASAQPRTKHLREEMMTFLSDSGIDSGSHLRVITDGAKDLAAVSNALPHTGRWVLDWAHIGRMLQNLERAIAPLAYGQITPNGSAFELWDLFIRFRHFVWTGQARRWKIAGERLYALMEIWDRREADRNKKPTGNARARLMAVIYYLQGNVESLIDYRQWQQQSKRISTSFVESTINRLIGRRMCKGQQMRWSRDGAHGLLQVRASLLNHELDDRMHRWYPWIGGRRISWPSMSTSHPF